MSSFEGSQNRVCNYKLGQPLADSDKQAILKQSGIQLAGLLLWRCGLFIAGATGLYRTTRFLLSLIDVPIQIEIGIGLTFSGFVLVMVSLVMERVVDSRNEKDLKL